MCVSAIECIHIARAVVQKSLKEFLSHNQSDVYLINKSHWVSDNSAHRSVTSSFSVGTVNDYVTEKCNESVKLAKHGDGTSF